MGKTENFNYKIQLHVDGMQHLAKLNKALNTLGGSQAVKTKRAIQKIEREIKLLGGSAKKTNIIFSRFTKGIAIGNIAANAFTKSLQLLKQGFVEVGEAVLVAAQIEETGNVLEFVGNRAGYSAGELENYKAQLIKSGIAQRETNQAILRALQAHIELGDAVKLGRLAQDAAVIGLTNSSEAYTRIIESVAKLFPRLLKELGIIINLNNAYATYAKEQGLVAASLTETQKKQAFLNEIFRKGKDIAGAYETAMQNVSKRMRSLPRHFQAAQEAIGRHFVPALGLGVTVTENFLKAITSIFGATEEEKTALEKMGTAFANTSAKVERLNKAFVDGKLNLESYNDQIKQAMTDSSNIIKDSQDEIIANILEHATGTRDAMRMVSQALKDGLLPAEQFVETQNKLLKELIKRRPVGEIYFAPLSKEQQLARSRALHVFEIDAATYVKTVEDVFKLLDVMAAGETVRIFESTADAMRVFIEDFGFDPDIVAEAFGNSLQEGLDKAIDNLTPKPIVIPAPVFEDTGALADEDGEAEFERINTIFQKQIKAKFERNQAFKELDQIMFEAGLIGMTEYQAGLERIDREFKLRGLEIQAEHDVTRSERDAAVDANERLRLEARAVLYKEYFDKQIAEEQELADRTSEIGQKMQDEWLQRWDFMRRAVSDSFNELAHILMTTTTNMAEKMSKAFEQIGRNIVHHLINVAVNAMFEWLAVQATQRAAQLAEIALVKVQTAAYVSLAAAKSAVNPGSAPGRVAAATLVKGALTGLLGFDNPINDRFAFNNGIDFGQNFMAGLSQTLAAPDFGRTVSIAVDQAIQPPQPSRGNLTINFHGPVNDDYVNEVVIPEIERAARGGTADILVGEPTLTGVPDVNF